MSWHSVPAVKKKKTKEPFTTGCVTLMPAWNTDSEEHILNRLYRPGSQFPQYQYHKIKYCKMNHPVKINQNTASIPLTVTIDPSRPTVPAEARQDVVDDILDATVEQNRSDIVMSTENATERPSLAIPQQEGQDSYFDERDTTSANQGSSDSDYLASKDEESSAELLSQPAHTWYENNAQSYWGVSSPPTVPGSRRIQSGLMLSWECGAKESPSALFGTHGGRANNLFRSRALREQLCLIIDQVLSIVDDEGTTPASDDIPSN